jgi:hypothetical protein
MKLLTNEILIRRLSVILTIVALILWSYSIYHATLVIDDFGLLHSFPITYFIALALLTIASLVLWRSQESHNVLLFVQLCILITSLFLIPRLVEGLHGVTLGIGAYFTQTEYIIQHGHLNPSVYWYHEFPINWVFYAETMQLWGIDYLGVFHRIDPFIWQLLGVPLIYMFLRNALGKNERNYCWAGLWLLYLGSWYYGFGAGYAPQGFGFLFFSLILALLSITSFGQQKTRSISHRISTILAFAGITLSHWLSSVFGFVAVVMLFLRKRIGLTTVVLFAIFIAAWLMYGAVTFFEGNLAYFVEHALRLDEVWRYAFVERIVSTNPAHDFLNKVTVWHTALFLGIGFLGAVLGLKSKKARETHLTVLAMAIGIAVAASVIAFSYRYEIIDKAYLFCMPFIAYFGTKLLDRRITAILLCLLLMVAPASWIMSHYANESTANVSQANAEGLYYFNEHGATKGTLTGNYWSWGYMTGVGPETQYQYPPEAFVPGYGFLEHPEQYRGVLFEQLRFDNNELSYSGEVEVVYPHYIALSRLDKGIYYWVWDKLDVINKMEESIGNARNCNLIYANPDMVLYIFEPK